MLQLLKYPRPAPEERSVDVDFNRAVVIGDDVVLASYKDSKGNLVEALRLNVDLPEGKILRFRWPTYGDWDSYCQDVGRLFLVLAATAENLRVGGLLDLDEESFGFWSLGAAAAIRSKKIKSLIEHVFFRYFRPEVTGVRRLFTKRWCRRNLGVDVVFKMFVSILLVEDWVKKNAQLILRAVFPAATEPRSYPISTKRQDTPQPKSEASPRSKSDLRF